MKYMNLNSKVEDARWNEDDQKWHIRVEKTDEPGFIFEDKADVLINASGVLK